MSYRTNISIRLLCVVFGVLLCSVFTFGVTPDAWFAAPLWVEVPAIAPRPFFLHSFDSGTYFYGATNEKAWDSGWMGLWVNRKRVVAELHVRDGNGRDLSLSDATCKVAPSGVAWAWPHSPKDSLEIFFSMQSDCDTLYYVSSNNLSIGDSPLIKRFTTDSLVQCDLYRQHFSSGFVRDFSCSDTSYVRAVQWAQSHLLGLLAEHDSLLYAGIPWFNEGWGRDTFISLPGLLVTGHADVARKLLMRYAAWVDRDSTSPTYGRIPNRVRPGEEIAYNTADGTPWWILGLYDYILYSHDISILAVLLADSTLPDSIAGTCKPCAGALRIAVQGALARCDSLGFLRHGDADTWMDAVGPGGPVTPRGDRAVEIQALHFASLQAAARMAQIGSKKTLAKDWYAEATVVQKNFIAHYLMPSNDRLYDRFRKDGSPDSLLRPNQLFAVTLANSTLLPPEIQTGITRTVCKELVHPYGVLSLAPAEAIFHPFHMDEHYPKDDAYHNGVVWTWLSGPAKTALVNEGRADLALQIADYEANLMLTRGCVGTLPELLDAMPRKGEKEPALSGTVSQTWSIAEFLRSTYQDILGIRPIEIRNGTHPFWFFDPRIPVAWGETTAKLNLQGISVLFSAQNFGDSMCVTLKATQEMKKPIHIKAFNAYDGITGTLNGTDAVRLVYKMSDSVAYADGTPTARIVPQGWPYTRGNKNIVLAKPITRTDFPSLKPPPWDVLSQAEAVKSSSTAKILVTASDSTGDDTGTGSFVYPVDEHFKPGILDITGFEVREDSKNFYFRLNFRNLVQPGWHPEYGFQLTYAAICLHDGNGKRIEVGANSGVVLADHDAVSRIIYVGGGLCVQDDNGKTLCTYTPRVNSVALGDTTTKQISFSLPKKYFPKQNDNWLWTVMVGAQDDHGGAGMGEFRAVKPVVEQWAGGGNPAGLPNIYDTLKIPARKTH